MIGDICCTIAKALGSCQVTPDLNDYIKYVRKEVGEITLKEATLSVVRTELEALGIRPMFTADPDTRVFYPDEASAAKMVPFLTFSAEYYIFDLGIDCDDYGMWGASLSRLLFRCNGVYQFWGYIDEGYHAFCGVKTGEGQYKLFEPNEGFPWAGELFIIGGNNYFPDKWK